MCSAALGHDPSTRLGDCSFSSKRGITNGANVSTGGHSLILISVICQSRRKIIIRGEKKKVLAGRGDFGPPGQSLVMGLRFHLAVRLLSIQFLLMLVVAAP